MKLRVTPFICAVWLFGAVTGHARAPQAPPVPLGVPSEDVAAETASTECQQLSYPDLGAAGRIDAPDSATTAFLSHVIGFSERANCARMLASLALGLKTEALTMQEQNKALGAGSLDTDVIKKSATRGEEVDKRIASSLTESKAVTAESKKWLTVAIVYYGLTIRDGSRYSLAAKDYSSYSAGILKNASLLQKAKLGISLRPMLNYVKAAPGDIKAVGSTMQALVSYARANNLEVPAGSDDALNSLGSIDLTVSNDAK